MFGDIFPYPGCIKTTTTSTFLRFIALLLPMRLWQYSRRETCSFRLKKYLQGDDDCSRQWSNACIGKNGLKVFVPNVFSRVFWAVQRTGYSIGIETGRLEADGQHQGAIFVVRCEQKDFWSPVMLRSISSCRPLNFSTNTLIRFRKGRSR